MQDYLLVYSADVAGIPCSILIEELLKLPPLRANQIFVILVIAKLFVVHDYIVLLVYVTD